MNTGFKAPLAIGSLTVTAVAIGLYLHRRRRSARRLKLDVVMDNFFVRSTGCFAKPVWDRPGVLQIFFDDDMSEVTHLHSDACPGGHVAFCATAAVYGEASLEGEQDCSPPPGHPEVAAARQNCAAWVQRVGGVYLVEANVLGFRTGAACGVLSSAVRWALLDFEARRGRRPARIVLHLDVNGTLILSDVAAGKTLGQAFAKEAPKLLRHVDAGRVAPPADALLAVRQGLQAR